LKITDPVKYDEILRGQAESAAGQLPSMDLEALKASLDGQLQEAEVTNFGISNELQNALRRRLAVFHHEHRTIQARVFAGSSAVWQLTKVAKILTHCDHGVKLAVIENLPAGLPPLWLAAVTGSFTAASIQELAGAGLEKLPV